jgi:hypothetical protein
MRLVMPGTARLTKRIVRWHVFIVAAATKGIVGRRRSRLIAATTEGVLGRGRSRLIAAATEGIVGRRRSGLIAAATEGIVGRGRSRLIAAATKGIVGRGRSRLIAAATEGILGRWCAASSRVVAKRITRVLGSGRRSASSSFLTAAKDCFTQRAADAAANRFRGGKLRAGTGISATRIATKRIIGCRRRCSTRATKWIIGCRRRSSARATKRIIGCGWRCGTRATKRIIGCRRRSGTRATKRIVGCGRRSGTRATERIIGCRRRSSTRATERIIGCRRRSSTRATKRIIGRSGGSRWSRIVLERIACIRRAGVGYCRSGGGVGRLGEQVRLCSRLGQRLRFRSGRQLSSWRSCPKSIRCCFRALLEDCQAGLATMGFEFQSSPPLHPRQSAADQFRQVSRLHFDLRSHLHVVLRQFATTQLLVTQSAEIIGARVAASTVDRGCQVIVRLGVVAGEVQMNSVSVKLDQSGILSGGRQWQAEQEHA